MLPIQSACILRLERVSPMLDLATSSSGGNAMFIKPRAALSQATAAEKGIFAQERPAAEEVRQLLGANV